MPTPSSPQEIVAPTLGSIRFIIAALTFVTFLIHCLHSLGIHPDQVIQPSNTIARIFMLCLFCYFLMLRRHLSPNFVAERRATTPFLI